MPVLTEFPFGELPFVHFENTRAVAAADPLPPGTPSPWRMSDQAEFQERALGNLSRLPMHGAPR